MPAFIAPSRLFLRDVSITRSSSSSDIPSWHHGVSLGSETESQPRGVINHLLCTHIYAVALIVFLAAAVALRFSFLSRLARTSKPSKRPSLSSSRAGSRSTSPALDIPANTSRAESGVRREGGGREKEGISSAETDEWPRPIDFGRRSLAPRAGGFGETAVPQAQLPAPQQHQQQHHHQDQGSRHHRASWAMVNARSRGVSTNQGASGSGVHPSQTRPPAAAAAAAAAAERDAGQPYSLSPPHPSFSYLSQTQHEPDVGPQEGSTMEGGESWLPAPALVAHASQQADSDASSTALWDSRSGTAAQNTPITISPSSRTSGSGAARDSGFAASRLAGQETPRQFMAAPSPSDSTAHFPTAFAFQDRRPAYAASIPPELDGGHTGLSFIRQSDRGYMSVGAPDMGPASRPALFSHQSSSSTWAGFATGGSQVELSPSRSTPRRRGYNRMVSSGSESESIPITCDTASGDAQQQWQAGVFSAYPSLQPFAPSSFPSSDATYLPPPPPGTDNYGHDATFFDRQYQYYNQPSMDHQQKHGLHDATHNVEEHGHEVPGAHGETGSMDDDEPGASWKRHTRVHDGGVCLACLANGGGFYGDTVPLEERRPR